ncbi:MAG: hypothetical protein AB8U44_02560 [Aaplasma endosymbiont of Hyalomma asiaticum]
MTRLFFSLRCDDYCNGYKSSLPHVISLHRPLQSDLLGKIRLSEDGTAVVCDDFIFYVSDAYFASVGSWSDVDSMSTPKLVVDTAIDPLLGDVCSKYSDVVKLRRPVILSDTVQGSIELVCNDAQGLHRVFSFIGDALRIGTGSFGGLSTCVSGEAKNLCYSIASACNDFLRSYFFCFVQRASSAMSLKPGGGYGDEWAVDSEFFIRSAHGRVLLYDEVTAGMLSLLDRYAGVIPFMKEGGNKMLVSAALRAMKSLKNGVKDAIVNDSVAINYSLENACVASIMGNCVSDNAISAQSIKLVEGLLTIEEGFPRLFEEGLEMMAIVVGFSGNRPSLLSCNALRLLSSTRCDFSDLCEKYKSIADKLSFFVFLPSVHIKYLGQVLRDVYKGGEVSGSSVSFAELEKEWGQTFVKMLMRYKKYSQMGVLKSFLGLGDIHSSGSLLRSVGYGEPKGLFARFCLQELLLSFTAVSFENDASLKSVSISLGGHVVINHRISSIYACDYGGIKVPILESEGAIVGYSSGSHPSSLYDIADKVIDNRSVSSLLSSRKKSTVMLAVVCAFSISSAATCAMIGVISRYGSAMSAETRVFCLLLVSVFTTVAFFAAVAFFVLSKHGRFKEKAELYLCFRMKEGTEWFVAACSAATPLVSFCGNELCINGHSVPEDQYEVMLLENGCELPDGKCILLGISSAHEEGIQLLKSMSQVARGFSVSKNLFFSERSSNTGFDFCSVRYTCELSTRESFLHLATVLGGAGRMELLIAYLDAYVAAAFDECSGSIKAEFFGSRKWQLMFQDQARWRILDMIANCSAQSIVGNREKFLESAMTAMKTCEIRKVGFFKLGQSGFPFDRDNYTEFMRFVPGFDSGGKKFTEDILFNWAGVSFVCDRKCYAPGENIEGVYERDGCGEEENSSSLWDVLCGSCREVGHTTRL